jgi:hypothetical protein
VLRPEQLAIPEALARDLLPRAPGHGASRELFTHGTRPAFDTLGAAATMAEQVVAGLLQRERCARLVEDESPLQLAELLARLVQSTLPERDALPTPLERTVESVVIEGLVRLASDGAAPALVRAGAEDALRSARARTGAYGRGRIDRFLERAQEPAPEAPFAADPPPGSPIGLGEPCGCSRGHL